MTRTINASTLTTRIIRARALRLAVVGCLALAGCKSSGDSGGSKGGIFGLGLMGKSDSGDGQASNTDPLLGGKRIPPTNLPTSPGKDGVAGSNGLPPDPLYRGGNGSTPTSSPGPKASISNPNTVGSNTPYRPGPDVTSAALAMRSTGNDLVIDDRRPTATPAGLRPVGGTTPAPRSAAPVPSAAGLTVDMMTDELRRVGAKPYAPVKLSNGTYEFRCAVPLNDNGAMRSYSGVGPNPLEAVKNVYQQIRNDGH